MNWTFALMLLALLLATLPVSANANRRLIDGADLEACARAPRGMPPAER